MATRSGSSSILLVALLGVSCAAHRPASSPAAPGAELPDQVPADRIAAYSRVSPGLAVAGPPTEAGLRAMRAMGISAIINLQRPAEAGVAEEEALARELGLSYQAIPVAAGNFDLATMRLIEAAVATAGPGGVLLHCASANRASGAWAVLQVLAGTVPERALASARASGLRPGAIESATLRVIDEITSDAP